MLCRVSRDIISVCITNIIDLTTPSRAIEAQRAFLHFFHFFSSKISITSKLTLKSKVGGVHRGPGPPNGNEKRVPTYTQSFSPQKALTHLSSAFSRTSMRSTAKEHLKEILPPHSIDWPPWHTGSNLSRNSIVTKQLIFFKRYTCKQSAELLDKNVVYLTWHNCSLDYYTTQVDESRFTMLPFVFIWHDSSAW